MLFLAGDELSYNTGTDIMVDAARAPPPPPMATNAHTTCSPGQKKHDVQQFLQHFSGHSDRTGSGRPTPLLSNDHGRCTFVRARRRALAPAFTSSVDIANLGRRRVVAAPCGLPLGEQSSHLRATSSLSLPGHNQPRHRARNSRAEVKASLDPPVAAHLPFATSTTPLVGARASDLRTALAAR